jgi:hypothetical protein
MPKKTVDQLTADQKRKSSSIAHILHINTFLNILNIHFDISIHMMTHIYEHTYLCDDRSKLMLKRP